MDLKTIIEQLAAFTEKMSRPGVLGLPGRRLEKRCARELAIYFQKIGEQIIGLHMELHIKEGGRNAVVVALHNVLRTNRPLLQQILQTNLADAYQLSLKIDHQQESDDTRDEQGRFALAGGIGAGLAAAALLAKASTLSGAKTLIGTPYSKLNCSQFACALTGHKPAKAKELYDQGQPGTVADAKPGDIVAFNGSHVAVMTKDGLMDSTPERGVGMVGTPNKSDPWYFGPVHVVRGGMIKEADLTVSTQFDILGQSGQAAADWAAEQAAKQVTGIDETTQNKIADAVATGIEEQLSTAGTAGLIKDIVDGMTTARAKLIAATEINLAMSVAALDKMNAQGIEYKRIILSDDPCPICIENEEIGPIPVDDEWPSGDTTTPFHPNCRCAITGARPPEV